MNKFFIGRFVLQTKTPLAIHSGDRIVGRDTAIATDWTDLCWTVSHVYISDY